MRGAEGGARPTGQDAGGPVSSGSGSPRPRAGRGGCEAQPGPAPLCSGRPVPTLRSRPGPAPSITPPGCQPGPNGRSWLQLPRAGPGRGKDVQAPGPSGGPPDSHTSPACSWDTPSFVGCFSGGGRIYQGDSSRPLRRLCNKQGFPWGP